MAVDRTLQLHLFVTREERAKAHALASLLGVSTSQLVRDLVQAEHDRQDPHPRRTRTRR